MLGVQGAVNLTRRPVYNETKWEVFWDTVYNPFCKLYLLGCVKQGLIFCLLFFLFLFLAPALNVRKRLEGCRSFSYRQWRPWMSSIRTKKFSPPLCYFLQGQKNKIFTQILIALLFGALLFRTEGLIGNLKKLVKNLSWVYLMVPTWWGWVPRLPQMDSQGMVNSL